MITVTVSITNSDIPGASWYKQIELSYLPADVTVLNLYGKAREDYCLSLRNWQDGDVIAFTFPGGGKAYTYCRVDGKWPGKRRDLSDQEVSTAFEQGRVVHLIRDGEVLT